MYIYIPFYNFKPMKPSINRMSKNVSAGEFLKLAKTRPSSIKSSKILPPKLGSNGFGKIHVEFK